MPKKEQSFITKEIIPSVEVAKKTICVVMAHPDDAEQFFGGTTKLLTDRGHRVIFVVTADGKEGKNGDEHELTITQERHSEGIHGAELLGAEYLNLGLPDTELFGHELEGVQLLSDVFKTYSPDIVVTHHPEDDHHDHASTASIARKSIFNAGHGDHAIDKQVELFYVDPEGGMNVSGQFSEVSNVVDVTSVWKEKIEAFLSHKSQHLLESPVSGGKSHLERTISLAIARAMQVGLIEGVNVTFAEGLTRDNRFYKTGERRLERLLPEYVYPI